MKPLIVVVRARTLAACALILLALGTAAVVVPHSRAARSALRSAGKSYARQASAIQTTHNVTVSPVERKTTTGAAVTHSARPYALSAQVAWLREVALSLKLDAEKERSRRLESLRATAAEQTGGTSAETAGEITALAAAPQREDRAQAAASAQGYNGAVAWLDGALLRLFVPTPLTASQASALGEAAASAAGMAQESVVIGQASVGQ